MRCVVDRRGLAVMASAAAAFSLAAGVRVAAAQSPLPPGFPPGVVPPGVVPLPPGPGPAAGWCFNDDGALGLRAGGGAGARFRCQAPPGGQVSLRVTGAPAGVTAAIAPGAQAGTFVLTAKAAADTAAIYGS